jgi:hypothetical protein
VHLPSGQTNGILKPVQTQTMKSARTHTGPPMTLGNTREQGVQADCYNFRPSARL